MQKLTFANSAITVVHIKHRIRAVLKPLLPTNVEFYSEVVTIAAIQTAIDAAERVFEQKLSTRGHEKQKTFGGIFWLASSLSPLFCRAAKTATAGFL